MKISKYLWGSPIEDWSSQWKDRLLPSARSKVLQKWNASGKKPKPESSTEYTKRRVKEETKRTWRSDAADIAHGIGEGALALHPYTAIPYYGAKVGQDVLNGNINWETALNASIPLFHLSPQAVGLREATNVALEDAANAGSKTARNWRVAREINLAAKHGPHSMPVAHPTVYRTSAKNYYDWMKGENPITTLEDPNAAFIELRSHPEGHATVAKRHLMDSNGKDITFTFDKGLNRDNLLLLEFDDSHGPSILTLNRLLIEDAVGKGGWKGSQLAEEVKNGNTRESITFRNITSDQASQVIDFLDSNPGKDVYVHCLRGSSRSGAVDKFLEDFYGYTRPEGKSVSGASPEVYNALVEAYRRKHPNPKQIWVDSYYPVKLDESGLTSLKFFERPSRLSEAEKEGRYKADRNASRHGTPQAPYYDYSLVNKHYKPWTVDEKGNFVFEPPEKRGTLGTIHFSFNEPVVSHTMGSWDDAPTITILPYRNMRSKVAPVDMAIMDTYFPNYRGLKISSRGSKSLTGDKATFDYYKSRGLDVEFSPEMEAKLLELKVLNDRYEALKTNPGFDYFSEETQGLLNQILATKTSIDGFGREWAKGKIKPIPSYEKVNALGTAEGFDMETYPYSLASPKYDAYGIPLEESATELNYDWIHDPSNHFMIGERPETVLEYVLRGDYGKVRPELIEYLRWASEHGADFRKKQGGKMNTLWFLKNGSGIHIKKKNRGKFTSYCGGKVTDSCIRRAKASGNPTLVKRATFAANARKWKHAKGGLIVKGQNGLVSKVKNSIKKIAHVVNEHGKKKKSATFEEFVKKNHGYGYGSLVSMLEQRKAMEWYKKNFRRYPKSIKEAKKLYNKYLWESKEGKKWKDRVEKSMTNAESAAATSIWGAAIGAVPNPYAKTAGIILSVPDLIYDWAASIDEPSVVNHTHTGLNYGSELAQIIPGKRDDAILQGLSILGNIDDAVSSTGEDVSRISEIFKPSEEKITNNTNPLSVRESTRINPIIILSKK